MRPQPDFIDEFILRRRAAPSLIRELVIGYPLSAMIKGSETRKADYPVEKLLLDRWSPRAMSGEELSEKELMRLFEAARWAPSSFNTQQWRALYARRGTEHWQTFFDLLVDANKAWAKNAAVLVVFNTMLKSLGTWLAGCLQIDRSSGATITSLRGGGLCWQLSVAVLHR